MSSTYQTKFYTIVIEGGLTTTKKVIPNYAAWATFCRDELHVIHTEDGSLFIYEDDHYKKISYSRLEKILTDHETENIKPEHLSKFEKMIYGICYRQRSQFQSIDGLLNLKNGVLKVDNSELSPHSSEYFFQYRLDHEYDPGAKCDEWVKFLSTVFESHPEFIMLSAQIFGYVLAGGHPWLHRAFVLLGTGRNGKSTWLDVLRALLGNANISTVSIAKLDQDFSAVHLDGKLANILTEMPPTVLDSHSFKVAVGGERLTGSWKFSNTYDFPCISRFLFACNRMPKFDASDEGQTDRLFFIKFDRYFKEEERDFHIKERLLKELPGILNWSLAGLKVLKEIGRLPATEANSQAIDDFKRENSSVFAWCEEHIGASDDNAVCSSSEMYLAYKIGCVGSGRRIVSDIGFYRELASFIKAKFPHAVSVREKNTRGYRGIAIPPDLAKSENDPVKSGRYASRYADKNGTIRHPVLGNDD